MILRKIASVVSTGDDFGRVRNPLWPVVPDNECLGSCWSLCERCVSPLSPYSLILLLVSLSMAGMSFWNFGWTSFPPFIDFIMSYSNDCSNNRDFSLQGAFQVLYENCSLELMMI